VLPALKSKERGFEPEDNFEVSEKAKEVKVICTHFCFGDWVRCNTYINESL
jgi:hypothetical protein